ncbi:HvfC/BufC N-terminal domain-containing protein [Duganella callida]|uniref:DUF2063 domain-containing protein n=1 Tax=Duganella callida TaxID=2561932 RepID=A0A4Y9SNY1_9BURK|nr:DNA-binding domain-containing protein [Duganella callida]TFW28211.1 DUF2063 domain-containing protein [Duganella callida]
MSRVSVVDLQRDFQQWLVHATPSAVIGTGARAMAGLAVYQNNYRAQLVGCLEVSFPKLRGWIGEEAFRQAAITHIDAHPPHAWTLDAYADDFAVTLAALFPDNPDLREVAWIEHALGAAFVAADAAPLAMEDLAAVDWESVSLQVAPSLRTAPASTNAEQVWTALWDGQPPPESEMLAEAGGLLVWRRGYTTYLKQVDALEYQALLQLQASGSFADVCDLLVALRGEAAGVAKAGELLAHWLSSELITGIEQGE